jgi:hypothetical protein
MGEVMIRCLKTGKPVTTGIYIQRARFRAMPVFFSSSFCAPWALRTSGLPVTHGFVSRIQDSAIRIAGSGSLNELRVSAALADAETRLD